MNSDCPNILFILCDQLRARSVGGYGDEQARTPNVDRLCEKGTRFNAAYSTFPVCTPARASIHSGLMPSACHVVWNNQTLDPNYPCLADLLGDNGYTTAFIGKWHIGGYDGPQGHDYRHPIKKTHRHGWKDLFLITHGEDYRPGQTPTIAKDQANLRFDQWQPQWQTDQALKFLTEDVGDKPWILSLNYGIPHEPYRMPDQYQRMFDSKNLKLPPNVPNPEAVQAELAQYYGLIAWLDDEIGRVVERLQTLKQKRRTVIVFTSDHGWNLGSHGLPAKCSLYDESACVPLIIVDPNRPEGRICDEPVSLIDLMPTLLDMAGARSPNLAQGTSLVPLLAAGPWKRKSIYLQVIQHPQHLDRWDPPSRGVRTRQYKYIQRCNGEQLLFDMQLDPFELENLADDGNYREQINIHHRHLLQWAEFVGDPWPKSAMGGVYYSVQDNPEGELQMHGPATPNP